MERAEKPLSVRRRGKGSEEVEIKEEHLQSPEDRTVFGRGREQKENLLRYSTNH